MNCERAKVMVRGAVLAPLALCMLQMILPDKPGGPETLQERSDDAYRQKFGESTAPGRVFPGYSSRSPSAFATARPCKRNRLLLRNSGTTATQDVLLNLAGRRLWKLIHKDE